MKRLYVGWIVKRILLLSLILPAISLAKKSPVMLAKMSTVKSSTISAPLKVEEEDRPTKYEGSVKVATLGRSVQDEDLKSTVGWAFISAGMSVEYFDWLTFRLSVLGMFGEGAAQNYLNEEGKSATAFGLDRTSVDLKPFKALTLSAGVINYGINPLVSAMSAASSLGAEQKLELQNEAETLKLSLIGSEVMPSTGLSKTSVDQDRSPFFLSATAMVEGKIEPIRSTGKLAATSFRFGNLPSTAAAGALTAGNSLSSVSGLGENMQFAIGFAGVESAAVLETEWTTNLKTILKTGIIKNDRAFEGQNEGRISRAEIEWTRGNVKYIPGVTLFEVESDVTPGTFTILVNRMNNRRGLKGTMEVELIKQKISFFGNYAKYNEIESTPFLSDREVYNLGLEVNYDLFK